MKKKEMFDIPDVIRYIAGYGKTPSKFGNFLLAVEYDFAKPVRLSFLQKLFSVDPRDSDLGERYLIDCYEIDEKKAKALQPYLKEKLDLDRYYFMLECAKKD